MKQMLGIVVHQCIENIPNSNQICYVNPLHLLSFLEGCTIDATVYYISLGVFLLSQI